MRMISVLVIDDHDLFRAGITLIVKQNFPGATIADFAALGEAFDTYTSAPDVLLLDFNLKGVGGDAGIALARAHWPKTAIIVVTAETDPCALERIRTIPDVRLLLKTAPPDTLVDLIHGLVPEENGAQTSLSLSPRQFEILGLMREGHSNKAIARLIGLSEFTVRGHVQRIFKVTGANNRTNAVFLAKQAGLI